MAEEKKAYTPGFADMAILTNDERSRLATRERWGMPKAEVASATGVAAGTAGELNQSSLADRLKSIAGGSTPTAGAQQAYAGADASRKAMMASAFGRPGGAAGVRAMRNVGNQAAYGNAQASQQGAIIGAQEQQAALAQYAGVATAMRGADVAQANEWNKIAMANAGFQNQAAMANQDAALRWQQMNDQQRRALLALDVDRAQAELDASNGYKSALHQKELGEAEYRRQQAAAVRERFGQAMQMAATVAVLASDERQKTDIKPADDKIRRFLSALEPSEYRYRDLSVPGTAPGRHVSPMAQDIEGTELGRASVNTGPDGVKRVDYGRLLGTMLAAEAHLNKRIGKLEGGR